MIFAAVMLGVVIGGMASWLAQGKTPQVAAASSGARRATLRYETERLKAQSAPSTTLPATVPSSQSQGF